MVLSLLILAVAIASFCAGRYAFPKGDNSGHPLAMREILHSIRRDERQRWEEKLRLSEERYAELQKESITYCEIANAQIVELRWQLLLANEKLKKS